MDYTNQYPVDSGGFTIFFIFYLVLILAVYVVTAAGLWKMYAKTGRPGWPAIVPLYNWWVWVDIIGRPRWWFWVVLGAALLSWIPLVGIVLSIAAFVLYLLACLDMAKCFGRSAGTGIGLWLVPFVFAPMLGFGSAEFEGDGSNKGGADWTSWTAGMGSMGRTPAPDGPVPPSPMMMAEMPDDEPATYSGRAGYPAPPPAPAAPAVMATSARSADVESIDMASPAPFGAPQAPAPSWRAAAASAAPAPVWPADTDGPQAPYILAPRARPVATLGSWPPAPANP
jgi:hypothetical protein